MLPFLSLIIALAMASGGAYAQDTPSPDHGREQAPPASGTPPQPSAPESHAERSRPKSGVVTPRHQQDEGILKPPPRADDNMPVIAPPGTSGTNPTVQPK